MATYVIGDLQGCFLPLQRLLNVIHFSPVHDTLWFCGDLIARGPDSLACIEFVRSLGPQAKVVLGNHDLNFIGHYYGYGRIKASDQLDALLCSSQLPEIIAWLCQQPLIYCSEDQQQLMVHAGLAPDWDLYTALEAAAMVSQQLKDDPATLCATMYGNQPSRWQDATTQEEKWRYTINACTRMRFCQANGALELTVKSAPDAAKNLYPWYTFWEEREHPTIFFGHWAALNGYSPVAGIHALDTGCVWGNFLTAYCVESGQRYSVRG